MQKPQLIGCGFCKEERKNEKEETIYMKNRSIWELGTFGSFLRDYYIDKMLTKKVGKY